jgi:lysine-N-methylase
MGTVKRIYIHGRKNKYVDTYEKSGDYDMYIYLDIVKQFACEMCGTCCRNDWLVTVDEDTYRRNSVLFAQTGRVQEFNHAFIPIQGEKSPGEYAYIAKGMEDGCWFLDTANFCRLHKEAGHAHLDTVCQTFPRYPMSTARGIELTLSFSCPAVLRLVERCEPLTMLQSEQPPLVVLPDSYVEYVFPKQKQIYDPLRYYFEIEHHFIDILQHRRRSIAQRLDFIARTVEEMDRLDGNENIGEQLTRLFYANYAILDADSAAAQDGLWNTPEILMEHFFVNFIFKKPFYTYGLRHTMKMLRNFYSRIASEIQDLADPTVQMTQVRSAIMRIEFQFGHNRQSLGYK